MTAKYILLTLFVLSLTLLSAQTVQERSYQVEEVSVERVDMWSVGLAWGGMILHKKPATFSNELFLEPVSVSQTSASQGISLPVQISLRYGLDRHVLPGLTLGMKLDYAFVNINDVDITIRQQNNIAFAYQGGFLLIDTIGFVPHVEARLFTLSEQLFNVALPLSWEIYLYGGPRFNINLYSESKLSVKDVETLVPGFEMGVGAEIYLSDKWSLRAEYAYYTNGSDFTVHQAGLKVLSGELELSGSRMLIGLHRYF
jgi:hypothetical protein